VALVLDASVAVKWFLHDELSPEARAVLDRVRDDGALVPALFRWEVQSVVVRAYRDGRLSEELMETALTSLRDLPIAIEDPGRRLMFGGEAALSLRYDVTPYDAAYLAVALDYALPLATADSDLAHAARDAGVVVQYV